MTSVLLRSVTSSEWDSPTFIMGKVKEDQLTADGRKAYAEECLKKNIIICGYFPAMDRESTTKFLFQYIIKNLSIPFTRDIIKLNKPIPPNNQLSKKSICICAYIVSYQYFSLISLPVHVFNAIRSLVLGAKPNGNTDPKMLVTEDLGLDQVMIDIRLATLHELNTCEFVRYTNAPIFQYIPNYLMTMLKNSLVDTDHYDEIVVQNM